jgi:hypothetical protein
MAMTTPTTRTLLGSETLIWVSGGAERENRPGPPRRLASEGTRSAAGWGRLWATRAQGAELAQQAEPELGARD